MSKAMWYIFILILIFLIVAYYKGFSSDVSNTGSALSKIILYLQGRNSSGTITNYPS